MQKGSENFYSFGRRLVKDLAQNGDSPEIVYVYFDMMISAQRKTLAELFRFVKAERRARLLAEARLDELNRATFKPASAEEQASNVENKGIEVRALEAHEEAAQVFAGSLFVLLSTLVFETCAKVGIKSRGRIQYGRRIGRSCLTQVIRATSNNFRHYEEWAGRDPDRIPDVRILRMAGVNGPWGRNLCAEVFEQIGWRNVDEMIREIEETVKEIFAAVEQP